MNADIVHVIEEGLAASLAGTGNFGAHVAALIEKGVERYSIDYRLPLPAPEEIIAGRVARRRAR